MINRPTPAVSSRQIDVEVVQKIEVRLQPGILMPPDHDGGVIAAKRYSSLENGRIK